MSKTIGVVLALRDKCSPQLKSIADRLGVTEKEAKKLQKQVNKTASEIEKGFKSAATVAGVAIGSVVASSSALVVKAGEVADRIDDMSNKIGISRKGFQEWDYLLGQNGAHVESLQMGFKALTNQIVGVNSGNKASVKLFKTLGISIKDSTGKLKSQEQIFGEVVTALQKMPEGALKAKYANTLLGRSGSELMPLFNQTTEELARQRAEYKRLGIEISDSAIDAGNKFGDALEKMNSASAGITAALGAELLPVATDLLNTVMANMPQIKATVTPILQGIAGAVKFVVVNMDTLIAVGAGVVATFATFKTISTTITIIQTLQSAIKAVSLAQGVWNALMLANPIGVVAVSVGALVTAVILLWKNWDKVTASVKNAFNWIKKAGSFLTPEASKVSTPNKQTKTQKHATGTSYASGGLSLVGENGPELVSLPKGSSVASADKTQKLLNKNEVNVSITVQGNMIGNNEFINQLADVFSMRLRTALQTV